MKPSESINVLIVTNRVQLCRLTHLKVFFNAFVSAVWKMLGDLLLGADKVTAVFVMVTLAQIAGLQVCIQVLQINTTTVAAKGVNLVGLLLGAG